MMSVCRPEPLVDLVAADLAQVVAAEVEEQRVQQRARVVRVGRVARAQAAVELEQRLLGVAGRVLVERRLHEAVVACPRRLPSNSAQDLLVGALVRPR